MIWFLSVHDPIISYSHGYLKTKTEKEVLRKDTQRN